ncbi:MAG: [acyl-carrier-protein] S-malonyltransferase [Dehalococcoidia bacterium]|nr:[acyl-carrier-protein] S-malonyltransferase [Dehalococcoidia bacterium]
MQATEPSVGKVAFLFPGQGTQQVAMGRDLAEASPAARQVFEEVDEALHCNMSKLIFEGPEPELLKTSNAQPAILAVSIAALRALWEKQGDKFPIPDFVAGHSLGEFSALVAAGALDLADAAKLVRARGNAMQQASETVPGGMAAILGLDELTVEEVCQETGAQIANINAPDQIIIAGDRLAMAQAIDLLTARGAKRAIALQVAGAFHSKHMGLAAAAFTEALNATPLHTPKVPVIANVVAWPLNSANEVRYALQKQLVSCVQWHRSVQYMNTAGVAKAYEFGPGRVLSNLMKRATPNVRTFNVSDVSSLQATLG